MHPADLQRDVRAAISMAYELSRHEHVLQKLHIAAALADLEFELTRIEAKLGGARLEEIAPASLSPFVAEVSFVVGDAGNVVAAQIDALLGSVGDIQRRLTAAAPHRVGGAVGLALGLGSLAGVFFATSPRAKALAAAIGLGAIGVALLSRARPGSRRARPRRPRLESSLRA